MGFFGRTRLEPETDAALTALAGRRQRPLAIGRGGSGQVVGLVDRLVYQADGDWHQEFWHDVERGNWDPGTRRLRWTNVTGGAHEVELTSPGLLPDLFNERVTASIACVRVVDLTGTGTAVITARRDLGEPTSPLIWRTSPGKGVRAGQVAGDPLVARELERLRAEYDLG